jgi:hypothetical protein
MVRITAIVDAKGALVATQESELRGEHEAGLLAGPGQTLHEIEVPPEVLEIEDPAKFHATVVSHLSTHTGQTHS